MRDVARARWKSTCKGFAAGAACLLIAACAAHARQDIWVRDWAPVGHAERLSDVWVSTPLLDAVRTRAGARARKCSGPGVVWADALACIQRAREEHADAYVSHCNAGIDSLIGWGVVSLASGELELYRFDSSPCGGGDCAYRLRTTTCRRVADPPPAGGTAEHICTDPEF